MSDRAPSLTVAPSCPEAPAVVRDVLGSSGRPLDATVRAFAEPRFGQIGASLPTPVKSAPLTVGRSDDPTETAAEETSQRALQVEPPAGGPRADFGSIR